jgi:hypothetical protein
VFGRRHVLARVGTCAGGARVRRVRTVETERERERQTDRQGERQTDRQRETGREIVRGGVGLNVISCLLTIKCVALGLCVEGSGTRNREF